MENEHNFLQQYSAYLDVAGQHLTYAAISTYVSLYGRMSEKERNYIRTHLENCLVCTERFDEVFDTENELDDAKEEHLLRVVPSLTSHRPDEPVAIRLQSDTKSLAVTVTPDPAGGLRLSFDTLPSRFEGRRIRATMPGTTATARAVSGMEGMQVRVHGIQAVSLQKVQTMKLEFSGAVPEDTAWSLPERFTRAPWRKYAAAAVVVVALSAAILTYLDQGEQRQTLGESIRPPEEPLAINESDPRRFVANPVLENFVDRTLRASSLITVIAPVNGDTLVFPYTFRWRDAQGTVGVSIVDNTNTGVWDAATEGVQVTCPQVLARGVYYVKFEVEGNLVYVQKFYVTSP